MADNDITSKAFRQLPAAERIKKIREVEDALWRECHERKPDPAIAEIARKRRQS